MTLRNVAEYDKPVTLAVEIEIRSDSIVVNYDGTTPQIPRAVNVTLNFTRVLYRLPAAVHTQSRGAQ